MKHLIDKYLGGHQKVEQGVQYMYHCPSCHHKNPRLSVNYNMGAFKCWVCGFSSKSLLYLLYYVDADPEDIAEAKRMLGMEDMLSKEESGISDLQYEIRNKLRQATSNNSEYVKYPDAKDSWKSIIDNYQDDMFVRKAFKYLMSERKLSAYEVKLYNIQFDEEELAIVLPSYDKSGELNYYITHYFEDGYYQNPKGYSKMNIIFNEYFVNFKQPVILTEGYYDAVNIGYNTIPLLGTFVAPPIIDKLVENDTPMTYIFLDGEDEAEDTSVEISKYLSYCDVKNKIVTTPEGEDGNSLSRTSIEELIEDSQDTDFNFLIKQKLKNV